MRLLLLAAVCITIGGVGANALQAGAKSAGCPSAAKLLRTGGSIDSFCTGVLVRSMLLAQQQDERAIVELSNQVDALRTQVASLPAPVSPWTTIQQLVSQMNDVQSKLFHICSTGRLVAGFFGVSPNLSPTYVSCI